MIEAKTIERNHAKPGSVLANRNVVKVLYLDDDDIDRTLMQMHVKRHLRTSVELTCVETLDDARETMAARSFDYLVTDNRMPPISSYRETLDKLDLSGFDGRIVVVSSETRFECFNTEPDPRVHCITDKADLSIAIKGGLFDAFR